MREERRARGEERCERRGEIREERRGEMQEERRDARGEERCERSAAKGLSAGLSDKNIYSLSLHLALIVQLNLKFLGVYSQYGSPSARLQSISPERSHHIFPKGGSLKAVPPCTPPFPSPISLAAIWRFGEIRRYEGKYPVNIGVGTVRLPGFRTDTCHDYRQRDEKGQNSSGRLLDCFHGRMFIHSQKCPLLRYGFSQGCGSWKGKGKECYCQRLEPDDQDAG
eukprot:1375067-Amorphochlora_amoeboformis.AAC.1